MPGRLISIIYTAKLNDDRIHWCEEGTTISEILSGFTKVLSIAINHYFTITVDIWFANVRCPRLAFPVWDGFNFSEILFMIEINAVQI